MSNTHPRFLRQHGIHVLVGDGRHHVNVLVVALDPLAVLGNVLGVEQLAGRRVLVELVLAHRAAVHEGLRDDGQARVNNVRLVNVEHEVRVLDHVDPEPQRQAANMHKVHKSGEGIHFDTRYLAGIFS